jgi:heme exporter protein C
VSTLQQVAPVATPKAKPDARTSEAYERAPWLLRLLTLMSVIGFAAASYLALVYAGTDIDQGNVQRIFYFHVAAFSGAFIAFGCSVAAGVLYLRTRQPKWDGLGLAGVEIGLTLSIITTVTGMVWARPIWNTWWTWDPRLTSIAVMVLTYAAYLMLRSSIENGDKRRVFAAIYAIFAISTVIFTTVVIRIRPDTIHPTVIGPSAQNAQGGFAMTSGIGLTMGVASIVWCCFITPALIWWRVRLENLFERAARLRVELY